MKYLMIKAFNVNVRYQMRGPLLKLCNKFHYPFDSQKFSLQIKHNVKETAHQNKDNSQLKAYCQIPKKMDAT